MLGHSTILEDNMKEYPETHQVGIISFENKDLFDNFGTQGDFGIQIAEDGRIWICINGIAFIRFKPTIGG